MANKKRIPKPPGGQLVCSDEQMAIVEVKNGEVFAECHDQPEKVRNAYGEEQRLFLRNWALSKVTREDRSLTQTLVKSDMDILTAGRYEFFDKSGNEIIVEFRLPRIQSRGGSAEL